MKRANLSVTLSMLAVFSSGILVGAIGHRLYAVRTVIADRDKPPGRPSPEEFRRRYVEEMKTRLQLDQTQLAQLNRILDDTREKFRAMKERQRPQADQIKEEQRSNIRAMLNASQRPEYEKMLEEREKRHRQHQQQKP